MSQFFFQGKLYLWKMDEGKIDNKSKVMTGSVSIKGTKNRFDSEAINP